VSAIEELLGRKSSASGLENRQHDSGDPSRSPRGTLYAQKLALTSLTSGGRSVGIVRWRTQAMKFSFLVLVNSNNDNSAKELSKEATLLLTYPIFLPLQSSRAI
jgi:hypothetical protein